MQLWSNIRLKSCRYAGVEVLPSSCEIAIADIKINCPSLPPVQWDKLTSFKTFAPLRTPWMAYISPLQICNCSLGFWFMPWNTHISNLKNAPVYLSNRTTDSELIFRKPSYCPPMLVLGEHSNSDVTVSKGAPRWQYSFCSVNCDTTLSIVILRYQ
jgi:hypothetical protein